ncbi:MAG: hypothetical protein ACE5EY_11615 [Anaerolineae bacterium]
MINPYTYRNAVRDPHMFFGRTNTLSRLFALLANGQSVSIIGDRRIGKSSLLYCAALPDVQARISHYDFSAYLFVHIDLQGSIYREPSALLGHLLQQLSRQGNGRVRLPLDSNVSPNVFEEAIFQLNQQGFTVVFLLDEFDCITLNEQLDIAFFSFLRYMANNYNLCLMVVSHRRLADLCHTEIVDSPFFNIFAVISLDALDENAARDLITIPSQHAGYPLAADADWVLDLVGAQPFFLQIACFYLLDAYRRSKTADLDQIEAQFYREAADHFAYAWEHAETAVRQSWLTDLAHPAAAGHYLTAGRAFRQFVGERTAVSPLPLSPIQTTDVAMALENLWNPARLADNPLAQSDLVQRHLAQNNLPPTGTNRGKALHDLLTSAIEQLRHSRAVNQNDSQWRNWYILHHKYVKEQPNRPIYLRLNLSERTFYRERKAAIEAVTAVLGQLTMSN